MKPRTRCIPSIKSIWSIYRQLRICELELVKQMKTRLRVYQVSKIEKKIRVKNEQDAR